AWSWSPRSASARWPPSRPPRTPWRYGRGLRPAAGRVLPAGRGRSLQEVGNIKVVVLLEDDGAAAGGGDVEGLARRLSVRRAVRGRVPGVRGHGDPLRLAGALGALPVRRLRLGHLVRGGGDLRGEVGGRREPVAGHRRTKNRASRRRDPGVGDGRSAPVAAVARFRGDRAGGRARSGPGRGEDGGGGRGRRRGAGRCADAERGAAGVGGAAA